IGCRDAGIGVLRDDDMVDQLDTKQAPCLDELFGDLYVSARGLGHARRMVMDEDDGCCSMFKGGAEYLARMNEVRVDGAYGYDLVAHNLVVPVQVESPQVLLRQAAQVGNVIEY